MAPVRSAGWLVIAKLAVNGNQQVDNAETTRRPAVAGIGIGITDMIRSPIADSAILPIRSGSAKFSKTPRC